MRRITRRTFLGAVGAGTPEVHGEAKPGEQQRSVLDATRIGERLGWRPEVGLEEGLAWTVDWFRAVRAGGAR